jgi:hypothetical protein
MKIEITVELTNGNTETYTAQPPEWVKWEKMTGFTIGQAQDKIGVADLVFLAYHAMKREAGGKPSRLWINGLKRLPTFRSVTATQKLQSRKPKPHDRRTGGRDWNSDE